ncbi:hypothetical protein [Streptomyces mirabilis]|uniref:hypothetical protein n=1 Tax=Streptomyces mirabilis TaxID=68239 RepID=UPI0036C238C2
MPDAPEEYEVGVLNWKTQALVQAAAGRPFIWVDDSIIDDWLRDRRTQAQQREQG